MAYRRKGPAASADPSPFPDEPGQDEMLPPRTFQVALRAHARRSPDERIHCFHRFSGQKFPPTRKQQGQILYLVRNLRDGPSARPDIPIVPVQDEYLAKTQPQDTPQNICKIHRHHFGPYRHCAGKMRRVRRALREGDGRKKQALRAKGYVLGNSGNDDCV